MRRRKFKRSFRAKRRVKRRKGVFISRGGIRL